MTQAVSPLCQDSRDSETSFSTRPTWQDILGPEKRESYFLELMSFVEEQRNKGLRVYPPAKDVFNALRFTPCDEVKVVILGQDPYHGPGQAHGLSFSVPPGISPPPSLENIFRELKSDLGIERPNSGCLTPWAKQGVLLLNAVLTVVDGSPGSHARRGWERFTDKVIAGLNEAHDHLVFLLWGNYAKQKAAGVDPKRHLILTAAHPSPLSASRGFLGCRHFSKANAYLEQNGRAPIDWGLK